VPWIAAEAEGADNWGGFAAEREEIATFIHENGITNLFMISGDAHMLAADDGTKQPSTPPRTHRASSSFMERRWIGAANVKGGPYSEGTFPGSGQFGPRHRHRRRRRHHFVQL